MISLLKIGMAYYSPNRKEYLIDDADDIENLPTSKTKGASEAVPGTCSAGSIAYTPDLRLVYILGNDDVWYKAVDV